MSEHVDTSPETCAVACMLVSNPAGEMRHVGWQKRVNDLIRALRDERDTLRADNERLRQALIDVASQSEAARAELAATTRVLNRAEDELAALRAENKKLRAELELLKEPYNGL